MVLKKGTINAFENVKYKSGGLQVRVHLIEIVLTSQPKHMLWVLKKIVSMRHFF